MKHQTFMEFAEDVKHPNATTLNEIYYKGQKMYKYIAWRKFKNYFNMLRNPHIKILSIKNEPIKN